MWRRHVQLFCCSPGKLPECPVLPNPTHGHIKYSEGRKIGASIWYMCDSGYTLIGSETRACLKNLSWSHQAPSCKGAATPHAHRLRYSHSQCHVLSLARGCDSPERPVNGSVSYSSSRVGSKAVYKCNGAFELVGSKVRTCRSNLRWVPALPKCKSMYRT